MAGRPRRDVSDQSQTSELQDTSSESDVINTIILPLLTRLQYDVHDPEEVSKEHHIPVGTHGVRADLVIQRSGHPSFVVDGKNPREKLDDHEAQILSYGILLKVKYGALCNGVDFRCYDIDTEEIIWDEPVSALPTFLSKQDMVRTRSGKISSSRTKAARKTLIRIEGTKQFSALLYKCEDLIRDNDGLTGESAFDQMSKILFMKMWCEKQSDSTGRSNSFSLSNINGAGGAKYVREFLFDSVKKDNPDLITAEEHLDLKDDTIMKIVSYLDDYTLLDTDIDVKGEAFEIFLGRTLTGDLGQFFTPRTIVDFTVNMVEPEINSKTNNHPYLVLDPCCGTGGFLISAFLHMCKKLHAVSQQQRAVITKRLAEQQIFGVDINPRLARVAKMNMFLHGDGHGGIYASNGLLNPEDRQYEEKFDLILTNPPFGNRDNKQGILKHFTLANKKNSQLREILFIERCISCLRGGGVLAIVLPDGVLNNSQTNSVRQFIKSKMIIDAVISLPMRSFKAVGANSKTSVLFLHKKHSDEEQPPIFMAKAEEIGFERKTKIAKKIGTNDLDSILKTYRKYIEDRDKLANVEKCKVLCQTPSCFVINQSLVRERLDASFFYAEYVFEIGRSFCRVKDVAMPAYVNADVYKRPRETFKYIEYGSIDKHVGDITNTTEHTGRSAPGRAKYRVSEGDVICAKMLDSEKNVAIVPRELDGQVATNGFVVLRPKEHMTSEALFVLLRKNTTTEQVRWRAIGTIMPSISNDDYLNLKIPTLTKNQINAYTKKISKFNRDAETRKKYLKSCFE